MQPKLKTIVIATGNVGKVREFTQLLEPMGVRVRSLADYESLPEIVEDAETFAGNALKKARTIACHLHVPVLADDSGLCVDALDGEPGVYSARYAGQGAPDADNNAKLLAALAGLAREGKLPPTAAADAAREGSLAEMTASGGGHPSVYSPARFVCALAYVDPVGNRTLEVEASCPGYIAREARGSGGFGYDPLFYLPAFGRTMAELAPEEKNAVSHRARAMKMMAAELESLTDKQ